MGTMLMVLQEKAARLSPQRQDELIDFAEFLLGKEESFAPDPLGEPAFDWVDGPDAEPLMNKTSPGETTVPMRGLRFDWCDGPEDPPVGLTSVELQHEATEWRIKKAEEFLSMNHPHETAA